MKYVMLIEVDVDEEGLRRYYDTWPGTEELDETVPKMLFREAVAVWDFENLLTPKVEPRLILGEAVGESAVAGRQ